MSDITLQIPDDLAERLRGREPQLAQILELGLREIFAEQGFAGAAALLELLATLPNPKDILDLRPSPEAPTAYRCAPGKKPRRPSHRLRRG